MLLYYYICDDSPGTWSGVSGLADSLVQEDFQVRICHLLTTLTTGTFQWNILVDSAVRERITI
jgi:hypothetical protein